ncbi:MAG: TlpA disulfide reductase family protein, partial [Gemmatimonadota bacterium]|nr:TlpA disulfide reductase family protein [Gemmatimonadota bacterium]
MIHRRTAVAIAFALAVACSDPEPAPEGASSAASEASPEAVGDEGPSGARRAPEAALETLDGEEVSLAALRGDIAIVNFWGTWCLPCRTELPELAELADAYADRGVRVVGVAIDSGTPDEIRSFAREYGVDYELWVGDMETAVSEFGAVGY